jgi:geranylgeranyl diphosphate synthase type I
VIHALRTGTQSDTLARLYRQPDISHTDAAQLLDILAQAGARDYTEGVAAFYHQQALAALDTAHGDNTALAELRALAEQLVGRQN